MSSTKTIEEHYPDVSWSDKVRCGHIGEVIYDDPTDGTKQVYFETINISPWLPTSCLTDISAETVVLADNLLEMHEWLKDSNLEARIAIAESELS